MFRQLYIGSPCLLPIVGRQSGRSTLYLEPSPVKCNYTGVAAPLRRAGSTTMQHPLRPEVPKKNDESE